MKEQVYVNLFKDLHAVLLHFFNSVAFYRLKYKSVCCKNVHVIENYKIFDNLDLETCVAWRQPGTSRKGKRLQ
jgi:hypothetical protein